MNLKNLKNAKELFIVNILVLLFLLYASDGLSKLDLKLTLCLWLFLIAALISLIYWKTRSRLVAKIIQIYSYVQLLAVIVIAVVLSIDFINYLSPGNHNGAPLLFLPIIVIFDLIVVSIFSWVGWSSYKFAGQINQQ